MQQRAPESQTIPSRSTPATITLDVTGMRCAGCVRAVEQQLTHYPGVRSASVNLVTEVAVAECESAVDPEALAQTVTEAGFPAQPRYPDAEEMAASPSGQLSLDEQRQRMAQQQLRQLTIAILLLVLSSLGHLGQMSGLTAPGLSNIWFHCGLATVALVGPGRAMVLDGWQGLRRNAPNMNTLVSLGTLTAYSTSLIALLFPNLGWECFFDEPVMLVGFILLGRTLEQRARSRAASAFQSLLALQPKVARLIGKDATQSGQQDVEASWLPQPAIEIPVNRVRLGEWVQVLPGDQIPVDGEIVAGQTTVDESMLTGESLPVLKQPGDVVAAGTLNQSSPIALRATRTGKDTTLAQIIRLVESAQTRKAPIQHLADTVAGYFTYGVMAIAALTFLFWFFLGSHLWPDVLMPTAHEGMASEHAIRHLFTPHSLSVHPSPLLLSLKIAIAVLVVACPCALGLATPTALLVGSGIGAERGLLIRGGDVLERVHQLDTVVLDKTGTLTTGHPTLTDCVVLAQSEATDLTAERLLQLAASVEQGTQHPLAIAIQQQAHQRQLPFFPADAFITVPGLGIAATVFPTGELNAPASVVVGTQGWLEQQEIAVHASAQVQAQALAEQGKTIAYVATNGILAGLIAVRDPLRADAVETVQALKNLGMQVKILTGDRKETTLAIAQPLHLDSSDVLSDIRPEGKAAMIAQLQAEGRTVAMVGDGINDAPALAQADVGIALQSGTDIAVETASIVLVGDRLSDVVESITLSRATFNKIRQNLFWAFAYNALGIPLAAGVLLPSLGVLLSPAAAGAMMAFSSVSVVTNSLLLYLTVSHASTKSARGCDRPF